MTSISENKLGAIGSRSSSVRTKEDKPSIPLAYRPAVGKDK
jgi:hypothetical protein